MKTPLGFDPDEHEYGPATSAVRTLLRTWSEIDWFTRTPGNEHEAARLFEDHHFQARAIEPENFAPVIDVLIVRRGWDELARLAARVRDPNGPWDWKWGVLKQLARHHSIACGWDLNDAPEILSSADRQPGTLLVRMGQTYIWTLGSTRIVLDPACSAGEAELAHFFYTYAMFELIDCIEWQLAEKSDVLDGNPFVPLLRCYALGFLPIGLTPTSFVLFALR